MEYPIFLSPDGQEYKCILYAADILGMSGCEWFGFEIVETTSKDTLYYGWVVGLENSLGYFGVNELEEMGAFIYDTPIQLTDIIPPVGWILKESIFGIINEIKNEIDFAMFDEMLRIEENKKMIDNAIQKTGENFLWN